MKAAVVTSFDSPPRWADCALPERIGDDAMVVDVIAAGLHPRVRSQADGSHYTSTAELPLVPGIDGVGRDPQGALRYFILPDTTLGAMAEQTVIDRRRSIVLPEGSEPVAIAAAMNPAMSSWLALRRRVDFPAGQNVLVLGATGNAGQLAIQVAKLCGADQVLAVGRDENRLADLRAVGATGTVALDGEGYADRLGVAAAETDVVLDYLWGEPTATAMAAMITARPDRSRPLSWIQIGSVAGSTAPIPSAALRAARLQILGSGQGSISTRDILTELPALAREITSGTLAVDPRPMPMSEVEQAWADGARFRERIVLTRSVSLR